MPLFLFYFSLSLGNRYFSEPRGRQSSALPSSAVQQNSLTGKQQIWTGVGDDQQGGGVLPTLWVSWQNAKQKKWSPETCWCWAEVVLQWKRLPGWHWADIVESPQWWCNSQGLPHCHDLAISPLSETILAGSEDDVVMESLSITTRICDLCACPAIICSFLASEWARLQVLCGKSPGCPCELLCHSTAQHDADVRHPFPGIPAPPFWSWSPATWSHTVPSSHMPLPAGSVLMGQFRELLHRTASCLRDIQLSAIVRWTPWLLLVHIMKI